MTTAHHFIAKDFSIKARNALTRKGITIIGCCTIPNAETGSFANGERAYQLSNNGCGQIRTYAEVKALASV